MSKTRLNSLACKKNNAAYDHPGIPAYKGHFENPELAALPTSMSMWSRVVVTNPLVTSIYLVMVKAAYPIQALVKRALLNIFLLTAVLLVHPKCLDKAIVLTTRELLLSLDMTVLAKDPILIFLQAMMVLILLVKSLGKVADSTRKELVLSLDMVLLVTELILAMGHSSIAQIHTRSARTQDLIRDPEPGSKAMTVPYLMIVAPKY